MSESRPADYLDRMLQASTQACAFVAGLSRDDLRTDLRTQRAVVMSLVIIGEAATKIMERHADFVQQHPLLPWRSMRGMRNRIAHGYFDINLNVVWETVQSALPDLLKQLAAVRTDAGPRT